jgi:hypothetical protein
VGIVEVLAAGGRFAFSGLVEVWETSLLPGLPSPPKIGP